MIKPILCLDFDGVLHSYTSPWQGPDIIPDLPTPGMVEFLDKAIEHFDVRIYSSRSNHDGGISAMRTWLRHFVHLAFALDKDKYGPSHAQTLRAKEILSKVIFAGGKPAAFVTLDDRALCFTGVWPSMESLLAFKPWNKL